MWPFTCLGFGVNIMMVCDIHRLQVCFIPKILHLCGLILCKLGKSESLFLEVVVARLASWGSGSASQQGVNLLHGLHSQIFFTRHGNNRKEKEERMIWTRLKHGQINTAIILLGWGLLVWNHRPSLQLTSRLSPAPLGRKDFRPEHIGVHFPFCYCILEYPAHYLICF